MSKPILLHACAVVLCACSSNAGPGDSGSGSASGAASSAGSGAGAPMSMSTPCPDNYKTFAVGPNGTVVTDPVTNISMRVDDGPIPPVFGDNPWTVTMTDATGAPAANAHITWACAYMNAHGHGSNPKRLTNLGDGRYSFSGQLTRMYGPWEIQYWIDPTGAAPDYSPTTILEDGKQCRPTSGPAGKPSFQFNICVPDSTD